MGTLIKSGLPCPVCGSKDNLSRYSDGDYCFTPNCTNKHGKPIPTKIQDFPTKYIHSSLEWRSITKSTCVTYNVRSRNKVVAFPYYYNGLLYAIKYRDCNLKKSHENHMWIDKQQVSPFTMFGIPQLQHSKKVAIAGGEFDAMAVRQLARVPCLSPPNGDGSLDKAVREHAELLATFEEIYLIPDNDAVSHEAFREAAKLLPKGAVRFVALSRTDPNEYLMVKEYEAFNTALYGAKPQSESLYFTSVLSAAEEGFKEYYTSTPLDQYCRFLSNEVTILLGHPQQGKSTFSRWLSMHLAMQGYKVLFLSLEEKPKRTAVKFKNEFENLEAMQDSIILSKLHGSQKPEQFITDINTLLRLHKPEFCIVDNLTALADPNQTLSSINAHMSSIIGISEDFPTHFICISHTSREVKHDKAPKLYDAFGSSFIEKFAANFISIFVPQLNITEFEVLKSRNGTKTTEPIKAFFSKSKGYSFSKER